MTLQAVQRLVYLVGPYPNTAISRGGVEASVAGLARALERTGQYKVHIFAVPNKSAPTRPAPSTEAALVTRLRLPLNLLASGIIHVPRILAAVRTGNAILHVHGTGVLEVGTLLASRAIGRKPIWTLHGLTSIETRTKFKSRPSARSAATWLLYSLLERLALLVAWHVIVDTNYVRRAVSRQRRRRLSVIPQGFEPSALRSSDGPAPSEQNNRLTILSLGVMTPRKGHHLTIQAFSRVVRTQPRAHLVVAGAAFDRAYIDHLRQLVTDLKLEGRVDILLDVPPRELAHVIESSTIMALHSQEESQGISLCEGLAAGLPVVSTDVGGIPDVVTNGLNGLLSPYGDIDTFANNVDRVLGDEEMRAHMSDAAVQAAQRFSWPIIAQSVGRLYEQSQKR